jgi:hypothetical protein
MKSIEGFHRFLDERLYDPDKLGATPAAERYWKTIVGKFPKLHYSL